MNITTRSHETVMVGILLVNTWFHFFLFEAWKLFRAGETQVYPSKPFLSTFFLFSSVYVWLSLSQRKCLPCVTSSDKKMVVREKGGNSLSIFTELFIMRQFM